MEERAKYQLEGLLQARSEDIRHGRGPRRRPSASAVLLERPLAPAIRSYDTSAVRSIASDDMGEQIGGCGLVAKAV